MNYEKAKKINGLVTGTCFLFIALANMFMKNEFARLVLSLISALILTGSEGIFIKRAGEKVTRSDYYFLVAGKFLVFVYIVELFRGDF